MSDTSRPGGRRHVLQKRTPLLLRGFWRMLKGLERWFGVVRSMQFQMMEP